jgi:uncharacterized phage-associated protein
MFNARDIARHLIKVGYVPDAPEESTLIAPLRLQKLLYYCQGWSLALLGRPLFGEQIQAWRHGPVVPGVYEMFKGTRTAITPEIAGEPEAPLGEAEESMIRMVWSEYVGQPDLVGMTHREPAWIEARAGLPDGERCSNELNHETMRKFFRAEATRKSHGSTDDALREWQQYDTWLNIGKPTVSAEELFGELLGPGA